MRMSGQQVRGHWVLVTAVAAAVGVALTAVFVSRRRDTLGPEGVVDATARRRGGSPEQRGRVRRYGIDVARLRDVGQLEPTVHYLTYVQSRRGSPSEHILFVRQADLDSIAALEGDDPDRFLDRLQQLGVVISVN